MRTRTLYDKQGNRVAEWRDGVLVFGAEPETVLAPMVMADLPGYDSPIDGRWVEGRVQRREDLKRSGSRPWEGRAAEEKEAARQRAYIEESHNRAADRAVQMGYAQLSTQSRRILRGE